MSENHGLTAFRPSSLRIVDGDGNAAVTFYPDGRVEAGPGLSDEEATRKMFETMVRVYPELFRAWAEKLNP